MNSPKPSTNKPSLDPSRINQPSLDEGGTASAPIAGHNPFDGKNMTWFQSFLNKKFPSIWNWLHPQPASPSPPGPSINDRTTKNLTETEKKEEVLAYEHKEEMVAAKKTIENKLKILRSTSNLTPENINLLKDEIASKKDDSSIPIFTKKEEKHLKDYIDQLKFKDEYNTTLNALSGILTNFQLNDKVESRKTELINEDNRLSFVTKLINIIVDESIKSVHNSADKQILEGQLQSLMDVGVNKNFSEFTVEEKNALKKHIQTRIESIQQLETNLNVEQPKPQTPPFAREILNYQTPPPPKPELDSRYVNKIISELLSKLSPDKKKKYESIFERYKLPQNIRVSEAEFIMDVFAQVKNETDPTTITHFKEKFRDIAVFTPSLKPPQRQEIQDFIT